jgi:type II secretory pathway pseudopilin PulG
MNTRLYDNGRLHAARNAEARSADAQHEGTRQADARHADAQDANGANGAHRASGAQDADARRGFAILIVLLVLLALLALLAPFLLTVRNADQASQELHDQAAARIALDTAARHAEARLQATHPALDKSPYWDALDELAVDNRFPPGAAGASDPRGTMWDLDVRDQAGLIDLNSASPQLIANLLHRASALADQVANDAEELPVVDASGFDTPGFLWIRGEILRYERKEGSTFQQLQRGLGSSVDKDGNPDPCLPKPPQNHPRVAIAMDQAALAIPLWRLQGSGELRAFDGPEQARDAETLMLGGGWPASAWQTLARFTTVYGGVRAGAEWQAVTRVTGDLVGGTDCVVPIEDGRWFAPGTTVRIYDGRASELALVIELTRARSLRLARPVANSYSAYEAQIQPLARRPVNLNTAPLEVLEALFLHLSLTRSRARIGTSQAQRLARVVAASRPFTGFEDFLQRIVLPAAGLAPLPQDAPVVPDDFASPDGVSPPAPILDQDGAVALYRNGINANDAELGWSTAPYSFTSRDTFDLDLRASVNRARPGDAAGAERASRRRDQVELVVPQRELMTLWARQQDFDDAMRLSTDARWWTSGPRATLRWDELYGSVPPPFTASHLGGWSGDLTKLQPGTAPNVTPSFPSREENGWAQPWAARQDESGQRAGHVVHFDWETRDPEGRYLPDETFVRPSNDKLIDWVDASSLLRPIGFEAWIKPRGLKDGDLLFDVGGPQGLNDRVSLVVQGTDLVLRVIDAFGDHPDTPTLEQGEARWPLSNLPDEIWSHVALDVRGTRPDQISLFIDGMARPKTRGLTRLAAPLLDGAAQIAVETTEGFPDPCVLRIGNEIIEARVTGSKSFAALHEPTGAYAGRGGRLAREEMDLSASGGTVTEISMGLGKQLNHAAGTPVMLYGYALDLKSDVLPGKAVLPSAIGNFAVAKVTAVVGGSATAGDEIIVQGTGLTTLSLGTGIEGSTSNISALELAPADSGMPQTDLMSAFSQQGGYALLCQTNFTVRDQVSGQVISTVATTKGTPLFTWEVIRYSGWSNNRLALAQRGLTSSDLPDLGQYGGRHAFVTKFGGNVLNPEQYNTGLRYQVFVFPISIPAPGAVENVSFPDAQADESQIAQLIHLGAQAVQTEWVRYDHIAFNQLIRDDPVFLTRAYSIATIPGNNTIDTKPTTGSGGPGGPPSGGFGGPGGGGGGGGGGFGAGGGGGGGPSLFELESTFNAELTPDAEATLEPELNLEAAALEPAPQASSSSASPLWSPSLGTYETNWDTYALTKAVWSALQFRGVMGTVPHPHAAGTSIVPAFRTNEAGPHEGWPGRLDPVHLHDGDPNALGWPVTIQHVHRPREYAVYHWAPASNGTVAQAGAADIWLYENGSYDPTSFSNYRDRGLYDHEAFWFALDDASPMLIPSGPYGTQASQPIANIDSRFMSRIALFPSGERPRNAQTVKLGGSISAASAGIGAPVSAGAVPAAVVDEVLFGSTEFPGANATPHLLGAQMLVEVALPAGGGAFRIAQNAVRVPNGVRDFQNVAGQLPEDAGLLRIGSEIVCYASRDPQSGSITLAVGGRGLLGTDEESHEIGECVTFLSQRTVSRLATDAKPSDALLRLASTDEFPVAGTALVGSELVHWTRQRNSGLEMPIASSVPGAHDQRGGPLFRGRYGTSPDAHLADTPVIQFPYRYWDRWAERADASELAYFALCADQPGAWWREGFWQDQGAAAPGPHIGVLMRADQAVPWDAEPSDGGPLRLEYEGMPEGKPHAYGIVADRMEFRVFVKHEPSSFDFINGTAHGWKTVPRLRLLGLRSYAPGRTLRRVDE